MKILAIDSSGLVASVAVTEDNRLVGEYTTNEKKTHSQTLMPMLDQLRQMLELDLSSLDAIAVTSGPGSFTGLRIGAATAKGLGQALGKPLIAVPTVDAIAYNCWGASDLICPIMDARRQQVYTGIYRFEDGEMRTLLPQCPMGITELIEKLDGIGQKVTFLGDGVPVYRKIIEAQLHCPHQFTPSHMAVQRAASLAALANHYAQEGRFTKPEDFRPDYLRLSQAERERKERLEERNQ